MKRTVTLSAIVLGGMFFLAPAVDAGDKGWGFSIGVGDGGIYLGFGYQRGHRHHHGRHYRHHGYRHHHRGHVHVRVPVFHRVWVEPVYRTVFVGHDSCGRPVYRRVVARHGYYRRAVHGYRCGGCGVWL